MAILQGKNISAVIVRKKIFVLECRCTIEHTKNLYDESECIKDYNTVMFGDGSPYHTNDKRYKFNDWHCEKCNTYPFIVLPKKVKL